MIITGIARLIIMWNFQYLGNYDLKVTLKAFKILTTYEVLWLRKLYTIQMEVCLDFQKLFFMRRLLWWLIHSAQNRRLDQFYPSLIYLVLPSRQAALNISQRRGNEAELVKFSDLYEYQIQGK